MLKTLLNKIGIVFSSILLTLTLNCIKVETGIVIDKRYEPERVYTEEGLIIFMPYEEQKLDDEDWILVIGGHYVTKKGNVRWVTDEYYVSKGVWGSYEIGDTFVPSEVPHEIFDPDRDFIYK